MSETPHTLSAFYKGWTGYQQNLVAMLAPLTSEQLALPASAHHWTIGMVAQHIVGNRVWWFQVWMGEGSPDLAPLAHWDPAAGAEQPALDAAALVNGLEASWRMIADTLDRWTAADLGRMFSPPAVMSEEERAQFGDLSRQWIVWHVLEHEMLHGGELSLALGAYGLPGIYGAL